MDLSLLEDFIMATPLFPLSLALCLGILLGSKISSSLSFLLFSTFFLILSSWLLWLLEKTRLLSWVLLLGFIFLGLAWPSIYDLGFGSPHLRTLVRSGKIDLAQPCRVIGICSKSSVQRGIGEQIEIDVEIVENRFSKFSTRGKIRLALYYQKAASRHNLESETTSAGTHQTVPSSPLLNAGERIEILANLRRPKNFNNPGQFDYVSYLERQEVFLVGTIKNELLITHLAAGQGNLFLRSVRQWRAALLNQLNSASLGSEDVKAILRALLLGEKQGLGPKVEEDFQATGIYHVLVISGQHVAIMAGVLFGLFKIVRFPRVVSVLLTMSGLAVFCFITEAQPSIVRATLMTFSFLIVLCLDRDRNLLNSLSLAALVVLLVDPFWLFDPGFQLSFLAVLSIALIGLPLLRHITQPYRGALWQLEEVSFDAHFTPKMADLRIALRMRIESIRKHWPFPLFHFSQELVVVPLKVLLGLADVLLISLSIQLVFFVLMILYFHRVSLISIFLNVLVVPLVGLLVPLGFLFLLLSLISPMASLLVGKLCGWLTEYLLLAAQTFATPSWGNYRLPTPPVWLVVLYFSFLLLFLISSTRRIVRGLSGAVAISTLGLLLLQPFPPANLPNHLQLTFLDVRQGDSIFLQFPDSSNMLIDGGGLLGRSFGEDFSEESFDVGERVVSPFLWSRGVKSLDVVVLTHAHHDHMAGLYSILDNFQVNELWIGQNPYTPEYLRLLRKAIGKAIVLRQHGVGDQLIFHKTQISVLNPEKKKSPSTSPSNNDSLAFRLLFGSRTFLLTGDIERRIESQILNSHYPLSSDVLKVAHHGSRSSTTEEFLNSVHPSVAVISVAEQSPFGHPHVEVINRLKQRSIQLFRTDQNGAITISTDGKQLVVRTFLDTSK